MSEVKNTKVEEVTNVRFFVPKAAAETAVDVRGDTVIETLKRRAADAYGGFTTYDGRGGWVNPSDTVVHEKVIILETMVANTADIQAETFAKVNARWIKRATDEQMVMVELDGRRVIVE